MIPTIFWGVAITVGACSLALSGLTLLASCCFLSFRLGELFALHEIEKIMGCGKGE